MGTLRNDIQTDLDPPPDGLEAFDTFGEAVDGLYEVITTYPVDPAALQATLNDVKVACETVQAWADAEDLDARYRCDFSDDALSADEYFVEVEAALQMAHADVIEAETFFDPAAAGDIGSRIAAIDSYMSPILGAYGDALRAFGTMEPPAGAAAAHQAFVDAVEPALDDAYVTVTLLYKETFDEAGITAAYAALPTTWDPAVAAVEQACSSLQAAADDLGADVDLGCRP